MASSACILWHANCTSIVVRVNGCGVLFPLLDFGDTPYEPATYLRGYPQKAIGDQEWFCLLLSEKL